MLTDEEETLLKSLETEKLLTSGTVSRLRLGLRLADVAGRARMITLATLLLWLMACFMAAAADAAPFHWLTVLCACLCMFCVCVGFATGCFALGAIRDANTERKKNR